MAQLTSFGRCDFSVCSLSKKKTVSTVFNVKILLIDFKLAVRNAQNNLANFNFQEHKVDLTFVLKLQFFDCMTSDKPVLIVLSSKASRQLL